MLFILFQLGNDRYALDASTVVEVLPLVTLKHFPNAPRGVAGVFNYRGQPVPTIDLCELALGQPARERLSTRIIVIKYRTPDGTDHLLGLIAECATEILRKDAKDFRNAGIRIGAAPYLGPILMQGNTVIQWVHEQRLLSDDVRDLLFAEPNSLSHVAD